MARTKQPFILPLEQRFMFDAAAAVTASTQGSDTHAQAAESPAAATEHSADSPQTTDSAQSNARPDSTTQAAGSGASVAAGGTAEAGTHEVVFIDPSLQDIPSLIASLPTGIETVILSADRDGLTQISEWAATHTGYDAIHILSHGDDGVAKIGITAIDSQSAQTRADDLRTIGAALSADGDILLYGCEIGQGDTGAALVQELARLTSADVAASDDVTGIDGNWTLETRAGVVDTSHVLELSSYDHDLTTYGLSLTGSSSTFTRPGGTGSFYYVVQTITPATTGSYDLTVTASSFDNYLCLYSTFDPTAPAANLITSDDDSGGGSGNAKITVSLTGGTTYSVVLTSFSAGATGTATLDFSRVNSAPTVSLDGGSQSYVENGAAVQVSASATVSDVDDNWNGGVLSAAISGNGESGDRLLVAAIGGITVSGSAVSYNGTQIGTASASGAVVDGTSTLSVTLNGSATNAAVQALARAVSYQSASDAPGTSARTITITATDGSAATASAARGLSVTATNDAPGISAPASLTVTEDVASSLAGVVLSDDSGSNPVIATLSVATGTLAATSDSGVSVGGTATALTLTGTIADINAFIAANKLTYQTAANSTADVTLTIAVNDQGYSGTGSTPLTTTIQRPVHVTAVNDAPVLTLGAGSPSFTENGTGVTIAPAATVSDVENNWTGATLTAAITANGESDDRLWITSGGSVSVSGTTVSYGGTAVGVVNLDGGSASGTAALIVTFNASASATAIQAVAAALTYRSTSENPSASARTVSLTLTDGGNASSGAQTRSVLVTRTNDAPVLGLATVDRPATDEDTASAAFNVATLLSGASASDVDGDTLGIAISATAGPGVWQYSTNGTTWNAVEPLGGQMLLLSSATQLRFVPNGENGGQGTLSFCAWDGSTGTAGQLTTVASRGAGTAFSSSIAQARISVTSLNDAPALSGNLQLPGILEDTAAPAGRTLTGLLGDNAVTVTDVDSGASFAGLAVVGNTATAGQGTWQYSTDGGTSWQDVGSVSASASLVLASTARLRFVPAADFSGTPGGLSVRAIDNSYSGSFTATTTRVTANTSASGGTSAFSATARGVGITVAPVNDAPVVVGGATVTLSTDEETVTTATRVSSLLAGKASDVDGNTVGLAVTAASGLGAWQYSTDSTTGSDGTWTNVDSVSASSALLLSSTTWIRYSPNHMTGETASLTWRAWDGSQGTAGTRVTPGSGGGSSAYSATSGTLLATVSGINDAPTASTPSDVSVATGQFNGIVGIMIGDVDSGSSAVVVSITAPSGTLAAQSWTPITVGGSGKTLTLTGTVADLNTFLASGGLQYRPDGDSVSTVTLTLAVSDQGNSGSGGALSSANSTITVHVLPASSGNQAPVLGGTVVAFDGTFSDKLIGTDSQQYGYANSSGGLSNRLADLNADGWLDCVDIVNTWTSSSNYTSALKVWLSDGAGNWTLSTTDSLSSYIQRVVITDFDGDGDKDVLTGSYEWASGTYSTLTLFRNNGTGTLTATQLARVQDSSLYTFQVADIDSDGDKDIITSNSSWNNAAQTNQTQVSVYTNDGTGRVSRSTAATLNTSYGYSIYLRDVDGDGDTDLWYGGTATWLKNDGHGAFTQQQVAQISTDQNNGSFWWLDVNGDGRDDLINTTGAYSGSTYSYTVRAYINQGAGRFSAAVVSSVGSDWSSQFADVDGDGDLDLLSYRSSWVNNASQVTYTVHRNDGTGKFASTAETLSGLDAYAQLFVDLNGDGATDFVGVNNVWNSTSSQTDSTLRLALSGSRGYTASTLATVNGGYFQQVYAVDLDGDGDKDLLSTVWRSDQTSNGRTQFVAFINDGHGHLTESDLPTLSGSYYYNGYDYNDYSIQYVPSAPVADMDGDGDLDIFAQSMSWDSTSSKYTYTYHYFENTAGVRHDVSLGTTNEDTAKTYTVSDFLVASDPNGGTPGLALTASTGHGTWSYSTDGGTTWVAVGTLSEDSALLLSSTDRLRYTPDGINGESATLTFRAWDGSNGLASGARVAISTVGGSSPFSQHSGTGTLTVTAVNDIPTVSGPASLTVQADQSTALTGLSVSDPDIGTGSMTVTLSVASGTLSGTTSGTVRVGGTATARTLVGTLSDINAYLAAGSLSFTPTSGGPSTVALTVTASDGTDTSAPTNLALTVAPGPNQAPVLGGLSYSLLGGFVDKTVGTTTSSSGSYYYNNAPTLSDRATDLNGDAWIDTVDIAVDWSQSTYSSTLRAWLSDGKGAWTNTTLATVSGSNIVQTRIVDFDGDGDKDILAFGQSNTDSTATVTLLRNDGTGRFTSSQLLSVADTPASYIVVGDADGDGDQDIVTYSSKWQNSSTGNAITVALYKNNGTGAVTREQIASYNSSYGYGIELRDVDNDGDTDIWVRGSVDWLSRGTNGTYTHKYLAEQSSSTNYYTGYYLWTDLNADGRTDLVTTNYRSSGGYDLVTLMNNGDGTFTKHTYNVTDYPQALTDVDGDGDLDAVTYTSSYSNGQSSFQYKAYLNTGNGVFSATATSLGTLPGWTNTFGDVNGDGSADALIAVSSWDQQSQASVTSLKLATYTGSGYTISTLKSATNAYFQQMFLVDLDGDGDRDVLATLYSWNQGSSSGQTEFVVFANDGQGTMTQVSAPTLSGSVYFNGYSNYGGWGGTTPPIADMDGDGDPDLVVQVQTWSYANGTSSYTSGWHYFENPAQITHDVVLGTTDEETAATYTVADFLLATDPEGATPGLALTGVEGNGSWSYSTDGGTTWIPVGTVSTASALLLSASDRLRYTPDGANAETASITYHAWDGSDGQSAGARTAITAIGGTSAYSLDSATGRVTVTAVNDLPTLSGTASAQALLDNAATAPFSSLTLSDVDQPADHITVTITVQDTAGAATTRFGSFTQASLTQAGLTANGLGSWTLSAESAAAAQAALRSLSFAATPDIIANGSQATVVFKLEVSDGTGKITNTDTSVVITPVNDAPTVANAIPDRSFGQSGVWRYQVPGKTFTDRDGDALTLSATLADGSALPSWLNFDAASGTFSGNPPGSLSNSSISLRVVASDGNGGTVADTFVLALGAVNDAPTFNGIADQSFNSVGSWTFTVPAGAFTDVDGESLTLTARLANGNSLPSWLSFDAATRTFSGNPPNGTVSLALRLTATDPSGASASGTFTLSIPDGNGLNDSPYVDTPITAQTWSGSGEHRVEIVAGTFVDPDGDTLTYSAAQVDANGALIGTGVLPSWLHYDSATRSLVGNPPPTYDGRTVYVRVTANDGHGGTADTVVSIAVSSANDTPTLANPIAGQSFNTAGTWTFTVPANTFADADGLPLELSATLENGDPLPSWLKFDAATRTFSGNPPLNDSVRLLALKVTATDAAGTTADASFTVRLGAVNDTPVAARPVADQTFTGEGRWSLTLPSGSFTDADGDSLTLSARLSSGAALPSWLSFDAATGTFSGNPPASVSNTTLSLTVTANDGKGGLATRTFALHLGEVNDRPVLALAVADQTFGGEGVWSYTLPSGLFTDADGTTLTLSVTQTGGGSLPSWLYFDAATGRLYGNPPGDAKDLALTITATDAAGTSVSTGLSLSFVSGTNDTPRVLAEVQDPSFTGAGSMTVSLGASVSVVDPDGDSLSYSLRMADGSALPGWLSFNSDTLVITGNPPAGAASLSLMLVATDRFGATAIDPFTLTLSNTNDTPSIGRALESQSFGESGVWSYQVPSDIFTDADNDTVTVSATLADGSALPAWLSFDAASGTFRGNPPGALSGQTLSIALIGTDPSGAAMTQTLSLVLGAVNDTPVSAGLTDQSFAENGDWTFTLPAGTFTDADLGDTATLTATLANGAALPAWLSFNAATGTFVGNPPNGISSLALLVVATDGSGATTEASFTLNIPNRGSANDAPTVDIPLTDQTWTGAGVHHLQIPAGRFVDADGDTLAYTAQIVDSTGALVGDGSLPAWLSFDSRTRQFSGNPPPSLNGSALHIKVTADDGYGGTVSDTFDLGIVNANDRPTTGDALTGQSFSGAGTWSYTLPATAFADADGETLTLVATQADGGALPSWLHFDAATGTFSGNPPAGAASLSLKVTASDAAGTAATAYFGLRLQDTNDTPAVSTAVETQTFAGSGVWSFTVPANTFTDADGDSLTYTAMQADGSALPGWLSFDAATRTFSGNPPRGAEDLSLRLIARDPTGAQVLHTFTLDLDQTVGTNDVPTVTQALADRSFSGAGSLSFTIPTASTFADADGDLLTTTATLADGSPLPSWLTYSSRTNTFSGNPPADAPSLRITVTAQDPAGTTTGSTFTLTLSNTNDTPALVHYIPGQSFGAEGTWSYQVPGDVFGDGDGESLTVTATLANGSALPAWLSFDAATQTFSGNPPATLSDQTLTFRLTARDAAGTSATADLTLVLGAVNDTPTTTGLEDQVFSGAGSWSYTVPAANFADLDLGDTRTFSATQADGSALPGWLSFDAATRTFSGNPPNGTVSLDLAVVATDVAGASTRTSFTLYCPVDDGVNDAPVLVRALPQLSWSGAGTHTDQISAGRFFDPDGDRLTYSLSLVDANGAPVGDGSLPAWLSFDAATRTLSGNPPPSMNGETLRLAVGVDDGHGGTTQAIMTLAISDANDTPAAGDRLAIQSFSGAGAWSYTVPASAFSDADGEPVTLSARLASGDALPVWLSFDAATRTFTGNPPGGVSGLSVVLTARDAAGTTATTPLTVRFTQVNDTPTVATALADQSATEDSAFSWTVPGAAFADADSGDTLTLSAARGDGSALPSWLRFDATSRTFSGTPTNDDVGSLRLVVTATDSLGATVSQSLLLSVANTNDAPVAVIGSTGQILDDTQSVAPFPTIIVSDVDVGDTVTVQVQFDAANGAFTAQSLAQSGFTATAPGIYTLHGTAAEAQAALRHLVFRPAENRVAVDATETTTFTVVVTDAASASASTTGTVVSRSVNDAPTADSTMGSIAWTTAGSWQIPAGTFRDVDPGTVLTYHSADLPSWATLNAQTGVLSGTPPVGSSSSAQITLTARDGNGGEVSRIFVLSWSNPAPAPVAPPPTIDTAPRTEAPVVVPTTTASLVTIVRETTPTTVFQTVVPALAPTPVNDRSGEAPVSLPAASGLTASGSSAFQVVVVSPSAGGPTGLVVNTPLGDTAFGTGGRISLTIPPNAFAHTSQTATVLLSADQANGTPLPPWLSFDPRTGRFEGTPPPGFKGEVVIRVVARDTEGRQAIQTFKIKVGTADAGEQAPATGDGEGRGPRGEPAGNGEGRGPRGEPAADGSSGDTAARPVAQRPAGKPGLAEQFRALGRDGRMAKQMAFVEGLKRGGRVA